MIATFQLTLIILLITVPLYQLIPWEWHRIRQCSLLILSLVLLFEFGPFSVLTLAASLLTAAGVFAWKQKWGIRSSLLDYLVFAPWIVFSTNAGEIFAWWPALEGNMWRNPLTYGLSFYTLKLFGSLRTPGSSFLDIALSAAFFGNLPSGPIEYASAFSKARVERTLSVESVIDSCFRLGLGGTKVFVIAKYLEGMLTALDVDKTWKEVSFPIAWAFVYFHFLHLYVNFSGFSDIAIGIGRLFGIRIRENFNFPLLSRNIQEFWQRWHLSLSGFVSTYLFLPAVRRTGRPVTSIFAVFVLVGIWHQFTWNYLIWGICHGAGLAAFMYIQGDKRKQERHWQLRDVISVLVTITFVSVLSAFATRPSLTNGVRMLMSLVGA